MIKALDGNISTWQILLIRQMVMLGFLIPLFRTYGWAAYQSHSPKLQFVRIALATVTLLCMFWSVSKMPLADNTVLAFSKVFFVTLLAAIVLKEKIGIRRISALVVGFLGVVLIMNPEGGIPLLYTSVALLGAASAAGAMIVIKQLSKYDEPKKLVLYQATFVGLIALIPALITWETPTLKQAALLVGIGATSYVGQIANVTGYKYGDAAVIAPMDYFRLLGAVAFGYWFFDEIPRGVTWAGAALIIGASLYTIYREMRLKQSN